MKKILLFVICLFSLTLSVNATSKFYIGYKIDNIRYVKNKNGTLVYSDFKTIHKSDTGELAYCIQPGVKISDEDYDEFLDYNDRFKIDSNKMQKVRLIAKYGYLYKNHTGINWYVATQYLIWHAVMPTTWDIYFVDENNNRLNDLFINEINEINYLVLNHHDSPNILNNYEFNYLEDIVIDDDNKLLEYYYPSTGNIINNKLIINNDLEPGNYSYQLNIIDKSKPVFYNHLTGQDLFTRGEVYRDNINFNIHVTAGKAKINECDEKTFEKVLVGGTYEILDQDDAVVDEITCVDDNECLSKTLPVGYYKIRVKELSDDYEENSMIYDVVVTDDTVTDISVCSLKKEKNIIINNYDNSSTIINNINNVNNSYNKVNNTQIINNYYNNENINNSSTEVTNYNNSYCKENTSNICSHNICGNPACNISNLDSDTNEPISDGYKKISIPNTSKRQYNLHAIILLITVFYYFIFIRHEKHI